MAASSHNRPTTESYTNLKVTQQPRLVDRVDGVHFLQMLLSSRAYQAHAQAWASVLTRHRFSFSATNSSKFKEPRAQFAKRAVQPCRCCQRARSLLLCLPLKPLSLSLSLLAGLHAHPTTLLGSGRHGSPICVKNTRRVPELDQKKHGVLQSPTPPPPHKPFQITKNPKIPQQQPSSSRHRAGRWRV